MKITSKEKGIAIIISMFGLIVFILFAIIKGNDLIELPIFVFVPLIFYYAYLLMSDKEKSENGMLSKKLLGIFIIWVTINITLYIYSFIFAYGYGREPFMSDYWYPFSLYGLNFWPDESYDISELIVYTFLPIAAYYSYKLIKSKD